MAAFTDWATHKQLLCLLIVTASCLGCQHEIEKPQEEKQQERRPRWGGVQIESITQIQPKKSVPFGYWALEIGSYHWDLDKNLLTVGVNLRNRYSSPIMEPHFCLVDETGFRYDGACRFPYSSNFFPPGIQASGKVIFEVPHGAYWLVVSDITSDAFWTVRLRIVKPEDTSAKAGHRDSPKSSTPANSPNVIPLESTSSFAKESTDLQATVVRRTVPYDTLDCAGVNSAAKGLMGWSIGREIHQSIGFESNQPVLFHYDRILDHLRKEVEPISFFVESRAEFPSGTFSARLHKETVELNRSPVWVFYPLQASVGRELAGKSAEKGLERSVHMEQAAILDKKKRI
jgi:hypothetical protein